MRPGRNRIQAFLLSELEPGDHRMVPAEGYEIGVFRLDQGQIVAYRNLCPHQGAPVCLGRVGGTTLPSRPGEYLYGKHNRVLVCPWHGWEFDLESGEALFGLRVRLAAIPVTVEDGLVVLHPPAARRQPSKTVREDQ